jgi:hypothetical protein
MSCAIWAKVALTSAFWLFAIANWHVEPLQSPVNPENVNPEAGVAVSVTVVPLSKPALQVDGQLIPAGLLVTVPWPETATVTCAELVEAVANVAETDWSLESVIWHEVPLHAPPYPENWKPAAARAVSVMDVPDVKLASHVVGQLIPEGLLVTVPVPVTATDSWKLFGGGGGAVLVLPPQAVRAKAQAREAAKPDTRKLTRCQPLNGSVFRCETEKLGCLLLDRPVRWAFPVTRWRRIPCSKGKALEYRTV